MIWTGLQANSMFALTGCAKEDIIVKKFMTKKLTKILFLIYIFIFVFSGCKDNSRPIEATGPQKPTSEIEGLYEQQQTVSGGVGGSGLNLADIKIENVDSNLTKLTLTFGQGSQSEDKSVEPAKEVPKYSTSFVKGANRMVLEMEGVSYFSYKIYEEEISNSVIGGIFAQRPVDSSQSFLYVNIGTDYAYKVQELKNQIIISIHKVTGAAEKKNYYVTLDAFYEYEEGLLGGDFPMKPTICRDGENIILISCPFSTKAEAEEYISQNRENFSSLLPGKSYNLIELAGAELPQFSRESGLGEIAGTPIGCKDGAELTFDPLIINGRFLCINHDGSAFVYAQPNTIYGDQEGDSFSFEYLYMESTESGLKERLIENQFSSITDARFSHDSKYVAFIEQNDVLRKLQILSLEDGKLFVPADDSFGIDTASFVWDDDRDILYAINGEFQSKQLLSYDLTDPDNVVVEGVFEQEFSESKLQINGDKIYYANRSGDSLDSEICVVDITDGACEKIADGNNFLLSPDGSKIVINDMTVENGTEIYRLIYVDMQTGEETLVYSGQIINNITWSFTGSCIYYSVYRDTGQDEKYPYALYCYDVKAGRSVHMMDTITSALYASTRDDEVLLMCVFTYKNQPVPVTYPVK